MAEPLLPESRRRRFHEALFALDGVGLEGATVLGDGYVCQAWLLADRCTVARIPKHDWAERDLAYELALLPVLAKYDLGVEIPRQTRPVLDGAGIVGGLHDLVRGRSLVEASAAILEKGLAVELGHAVGRFLSALHAIPASAFPVVSDPYPRDIDQWIEVVRPLFGAKGAAWMDAQRARLAALAPPVTAPVLTHGDLWRHHLLVGDNDRLAGIIDFGLASFNDVAWDLRSFVSGSIAGTFGPPLLNALLESYSLGFDATALERARLYNVLDEIGDIHYELSILERHPSSEFIGRVQSLIDRWDGSA